ncbi:MAG: hypothetical protein SFX74_04165 [Fimbriimonadaceae bacterium]|nr:hypothetical protein [Fimbriimonadaceae bacterium]
MMIACLLASAAAMATTAASAATDATRAATDVTQFEFAGGTLAELAKVTATHAPQAAFVGRGPARLRAVSFRFSSPTELDTELRRYFGFGPIAARDAAPSFVFIASELSAEELRPFGFPTPTPPSAALGNASNGATARRNPEARRSPETKRSPDAADGSVRGLLGTRSEKIHWFVEMLPVKLAKSPISDDTRAALGKALSHSDGELDWAQWRPRLLAGARNVRRETKSPSDQARIDVWIALITDTAVADLSAAFETPNFRQEITPRQGTNAYRAAVNLNLAKMRESNQALTRSFQTPNYRIRLSSNGIQVVSRDPVSGVETIL